MGTARASNADTDMILGKELASEQTAVLVERRREHQVPVVRILVCVCVLSVPHTDGGRVDHTSARHDLGEVRLPVRKEKLIGLINDGVPWIRGQKSELFWAIKPSYLTRRRDRM